MPTPSVARLQPFTRRTRPNNAASDSQFFDEELRRLEAQSREVVQALKDLDDRLGR